MRKIIIILLGLINLVFINSKVNAQELQEKISKSENKNNVQVLDDNDLDITLEEFLNEKGKTTSHNFKAEKKIKINSELNIIETNFNWNGNLNLSNNPKGIILHHIEASRHNSTIPVTDVHEWHLKNGWTGIGYHYYITKKGDIYIGRPENAVGAHAKNNNINTIGIAVEGKYQSEIMPDKQKESLVKLGGYLRGKYGINSIKGHKDVNSTNCPGKNYPLKYIKNEILKYPIDIVDKNNSQKMSIQYSAHGQDYGWQNFTRDGELAGTTGQSRRMEAIKIKLNNAPENLNVVYRTHSQGDNGWQNWISENELAGSIGESRRLEAIEIKLQGEMSGLYNIEYRVHCEDYGWMDWKKNGQMAGTMGKSKRIEGIEIKISSNRETLGVDYVAQGEDYGWQYDVSDGQLSGSTGKAKRMEAIKVKLRNPVGDLGIRTRAHIEGNSGFSEWSINGNITGTVGEYKRMEAIQIELIGEYSKQYDIKYRVHCEDYGWMNWKQNGEIAGTMGEAKRIEGIEIRLERR